MKPRLSIPATRCDNAIVDGMRTSMAMLSLAELRSHVAVPVERSSGPSELLQVVVDGWTRNLLPRDEGGVGGPLVLSSRSNWLLQGKTIEIFERAYVLDGAQRLECLLRGAVASKALPFVVVAGLDAHGELALRSNFSPQADTRTETVERVDTATPRLKIDHRWATVIFDSDPFVVPTRRGYAPAVLVRRPQAPHAEHVLAGAKSLSAILEEIRNRHGTLRGVRVRIRKQGRASTAPYEVEEHEL